MGAVFAASAAADKASEYGIESVHASLSTTQAGAHPDFTQAIQLKTDPVSTAAYAGTQEVRVDLPPGLTGNPTQFPTCPIATFVNSATEFEKPCEYDAQVGIVFINLFLGSNFSTTLAEPLYNLPASEGTPARLGFIAVNTPVLIETSLRSDGDFGLTAVARNATDFFVVNAVETTIWGVPADPSHDELRMNPSEAVNCGYACGAPNGHSRLSGLGRVPFMTNPTSCQPNQHVDFTTTSYALPGRSFQASAPLPQITGCEKLSFEPSMSLRPSTRAADSPSGMTAELGFSQEGLQYSNTLAPADLRKAVVTLPAGFTLNPSAAEGLQGCSEAEIGLVSEAPPRFDKSPVNCPEASKVGTAEIDTPLLRNPLKGSLYVARQSENPFHSLLAGYLVAKGEGVLLKLAGRFDLDPATGRITATFDESPPQPFDHLELDFKAGSRGPLTTPSSCGTYASQIELTSWGGQIAELESPVQINQGPNGGPCPDGAFAPGLSAGTTDPVAGKSSPFTLRLTRESGEENVAAIETTLPEGVLAKLGGVPLCPDVAAGSGSCPAGSQVGTATVGVGSGASPLFVPQPGRAPTAVYLAGPYRGAPYSLVVSVPAQAGPFDLGTVAVRNALYVDPVTTQVTAKSDPLPQILQGVPVSYRDIRLDVNRSDFTLNPTSCEPAQVSSAISSVGGKTAHPSSRFQVGDCQALGFKPKLALSLAGPTHRSAHPRLRAVLTMPEGGANIRKATVTLPKTELLENAHIKTICTRVQYAAHSCPPESVYGYAKAWSPLLDQPLQGPVYLRSSDHKLPDLVASLDGQVHLDLDGRIDAVHARIRNTFMAVPDAPVSRFELTMQGGKKGLLANNTELCKAHPRATLNFVAHNGKSQVSNPLVKTDCAGKSK
jgi:hypothetical protein